MVYPQSYTAKLLLNGIMCKIIWKPKCYVESFVMCLKSWPLKYHIWFEGFKYNVTAFLELYTLDVIQINSKSKDKINVNHFLDTK